MSEGSSYRDAGVDIDAQERSLARIKDLVGSTTTAGVRSDLGSFGGLFDLQAAPGDGSILVVSADGVGTKLDVARRAGDFSTVGRDLVNHCVNDILVQGAEPLFFLDYVGAGVLEPATFEELISGVAAACRENGCALLGGETAEMPGFYRAGDYELVGFVVGRVSPERLLDGSKVERGDVLLALPSSGLHTNGYSLARKIFFDQLGLGIDDPVPGFEAEGPVGRQLLAVHRSYLPALRPVLGRPSLHALAHITGGGLTDNLPRVLPTGFDAAIDVERLHTPPIFRAIERHGAVAPEEMRRVFNLGVGMVAIVAADEVEATLGELREASGLAVHAIGEIVEGSGKVLYRE